VAREDGEGDAGGGGVMETVEIREDGMRAR